MPLTVKALLLRLAFVFFGALGGANKYIYLFSCSFSSKVPLFTNRVTTSRSAAYICKAAFVLLF